LEERERREGEIDSLDTVFNISVRGSTRYFTHLKWSLVSPDFKECCIRYS
jgi:hypothetical protein